MQRIAILGCSGSGKSTLARALGEKLNLPIIHMDQHYFSPGWVEPTPEDWREKVAALCAQEQWVMDGTYSKTLDVRLPQADLVIFLDFPTWLCFWRVLKRITTSFGRVRQDSAPGCPERIDLHFFGYVLNYRRQRAPKIRALLAEQQAKSITLSSQQEVDAYVRNIQPT